MTQFDLGGKIQQFDWGTILWHVDPSNLDNGRLSVGIVTFNPYVVEEKHVHSGNEQVIYVISGNGIQIIDDKEYTISPGDIKHIPPHSRHQVINNSPEELKFIIVYTPSKFQVSLTKPNQDHANETINIKTFLDYKVIGGILHKLSEAIGMGLSIIDTNGDLIMKTDNYPRFCSLLSRKNSNSYCKENFQKAYREINDFDKPFLFECCNNITSIMIPICIGSEVVGYIVCGQVFLTKCDANPNKQELQDIAKVFDIGEEGLLRLYSEIRLEPKNRLYSAAEATFAVASCITDMITAALKQKELDNSKLSLIEEQIAKANLEKALREADLKLLQSQIHPHFLFNTLNTIAQMAYVDGAGRVAELVWSLSDLLRFTLKKSEQLVPLREEIKMLKNYLHIQRSRFGDRLQIELDVTPGIENFLIPSMLTQPLVENAIIHGFEGAITRGYIKIIFRDEENYIQCTIQDNGVGFDMERQGISHRGCNGIGLSSVKNQLQYYFNDDYQFEIKSIPDQGTTVYLSFPQRGGSDDKED